MRLQLILIFTLIIAIAVGASWFLAIRTTDSEFAVLISENNRHQARFSAPVLQNEYQKLGSWEAVQEEFEAQVDLEAERIGLTASAIAAPPQTWVYPWQGFDISIEDVNGTTVWNLAPKALEEIRAFRVLSGGQVWSREAWQDNSNIENASVTVRTAPDEMIELGVGEAISGDFVVESLAAPPILETVYFTGVSGNNTPALILQDNPISWLTIQLRSVGQRAIVVDTTGNVVVDSEKTLVGEQVDRQFVHGGIPLFTDGENIGTFVVTSRNGVYTIQQNSFLKQVREGLLYGGIFSGVLALILAFVMADRITRPVRSLTMATSRIQAGEWGYQVKERQADNELGQLSRAFNQMSRHLAEQRSLRGRLVNDLAHELNTPLSLMRLELQGMVDGFQSPAEAAEHVMQELDEVAGLVSDLIFLASQDAARKPRMDWIDLNGVVANAVRRFEASASSTIKLTFSPTENLPLLFADYDLVLRAVSNLISNAICYTPHGGSITLKTSQHENLLEVLVKDTGQGIPSEHLPHIFERFYRVDNSRNRESGGHGLGLAIVKQIMEQHQGSVEVESKVGCGSTFRLIWPADAFSA